MTTAVKVIQSVFPTVAPKIAIVGEAPGEEEVIAGAPFVGSSGRLLTWMLSQAGINRNDCYVGNVFQTRPMGNDVKLFFNKRIVAKKLAPSKYPVYGTIGFVKPEFEPEIDRLRQELTIINPVIAIALGNTPLWALTGYDKITQQRGTVVESTLVPGLKVMPTFHPAAVLRKWDHLPFVVADLKKAIAESGFREIRRPERFIHINPTAAEVIEYLSKRPDIWSVDIETAMDQITCIGFAPSASEALVIPLVTETGQSYWSSPAEELTIWLAIKVVLEDNTIPKLFQNGSYDIQYLRKHNIKVRGDLHDTMIMHHALQPELPKGLGDLASLHTNERSWKHLRTTHITETKQND